MSRRASWDEKEQQEEEDAEDEEDEDEEGEEADGKHGWQEEQLQRLRARKSHGGYKSSGAVPARPYLLRESGRGEDELGNSW